MPEFNDLLMVLDSLLEWEQSPVVRAARIVINTALENPEGAVALGNEAYELLKADEGIEDFIADHEEDEDTLFDFEEESRENFVQS